MNDESLNAMPKIYGRNSQFPADFRKALSKFLISSKTNKFL